jgi:YbbR domain-containing protein
MHSLKHWLLNNWFLKVASVILAFLVWTAVTNEASSEIGIEVPLEYRNSPPQMEITGDMTDSVQVRLRGPSNVIRDVTAADVATTIDLNHMLAGEKIIPLSPQNVAAPFGAEVIRVNPSSVRFALERTSIKSVSIEPMFVGEPQGGYEVGAVFVSPNEVTVEGPESRINALTSLTTVPIRLDGTQSDLDLSADLDVPDPQVRLQRPTPVKVKVEIRRKR